MIPYRDQLFDCANRVAGCPHISLCGSEFRSKGTSRGENWHFADRPSPDFVGSNYNGLVIIAANPGLAHRPIHDTNDKLMFTLQRRIALGDRSAFEELMRFLPQSMTDWPQMVDRHGRQLLAFDIEDIAFVELVKCGTRPGSGNTKVLLSGTQILRRCWEAHTQHLLRLLAPTHVIFQWKPLRGILAELGFAPHVPVGTYNGARHLSKAAKYADVRPVFDLYYARAADRT